jgi:hypothetical protein
MSDIAPVSGVGKDSKRVDRGMVQRIQRDAKIQNASGGAYRERGELESLASAESTGTTASAVSAGNVVTAGTPVATVNAFAPGTQGAPLSNGAKGGPGLDDSAQQTPVDSFNPDSMFVRAMYAANPDSRQLMMMVEAYNELES